MTKLGFVSAVFAKNSFDEVIEYAALNGFPHVELMCWPTGAAERRYAGVTHVDVGNLQARQVAKIRSTLDERQVSISALGYYPNPLDADSGASHQAIAHLLNVIKAARTLNIGLVNTFIGRDPLKSIEENLDSFAKVWPNIIHVASEEGVRVAIENCPMLFTRDEWPGGRNLAHSPFIWRQLFEILPSANFGLNYDPSHMVWQMMDYLAPLKEFNERIFHLHLKDVELLPHQLKDQGILAYPLHFHTPRLPGRGDIDWQSFFATVKATGITSPACIEFEDRPLEGSHSQICQALVNSRDFLAASL